MRRSLAEFGLEPRDAVDLRIDGAHALLEDDLLRGRGTHHLREIALVRRVPVRAADVVQAKAEEQRLQP
ncbi:MAG: hypothetical protein ABL982_13345 [Vicinamibacterales bacterium]